MSKKNKRAEFLKIRLLLEWLSSLINSKKGKLFSRKKHDNGKGRTSRLPKKQYFYEDLESKQD